MAIKNRNLFQLPQGTEGTHSFESKRHREFVRTLEDLHQSWGYNPVKIPSFDYYDVYDSHFHHTPNDNTYRLFDREGDLLLLRPDCTLFMARLLSLTLTEDELPFRAAYGDTILRHEDFEDISKNEFFQSGIELIGKEGMDGDLEVLTILIESLGKVTDKEFYIHVGSQALVKKLFAGNLDQALEAIRSRDIEGISALIEENGRDSRIAEELLFISDNPMDATSKLPALLQAAGDEIAYLFELVDRLKSIHPKADLRIDLSEVGQQPYYTGIAFKAYIDGADSAVATGGRYDELFATFGCNAASCGFSIMLRKLEALAGEAPRAEHVQAEGATFEERLAKAKELRANGKIAEV